jgi:outer membrane protein assembly factor BamB
MRRSTLLLLCGLALAFGLPIAFALRSLVWMEWRVALEQPAVAGPLLAADRVLIGTRQGTLHAFATEDGSERWRARCGAPLGAEGIAARDPLVVCAGGGHLAVLDLATGGVRFEQDHPGASEALVALGEDLAVVAEGDTLRGVAPQDGAPRFHATPWPGRALTSLRVEGGVLLATSAGRAGGEGGSAGAGGVAALDATTGAVLWRKELSAPVEVAPERGEDLLFVLAASHPPQVFALDRTSGALRWSGPGETTPIALGDAALDALGATLRARDLSSGAPRWEKLGFEAPWSAPPTRSGDLALAAFGQSLFAFRTGGVKLFAYPLRGRIGPRLAGDSTRVYYVEDGTALVALDVD